MSLVNSMMNDCVFMLSERIPDGSGGFNVKWTEGETIKAAITRDSSTEALIAEAGGVVELYTVTVSRSVRLAYHAVIKRLSDGKTFRITSHNAESKTPACSSLDLSQSTAEAWRLTA